MAGRWQDRKLFNRGGNVSIGAARRAARTGSDRLEPTMTTDVGRDMRAAPGSSLDYRHSAALAPAAGILSLARVLDRDGVDREGGVASQISDTFRPVREALGTATDRFLGAAAAAGTEALAGANRLGGLGASILGFDETGQNWIDIADTQSEKAGDLLFNGYSGGDKAFRDRKRAENQKRADAYSFEQEALADYAEKKKLMEQGLQPTSPEQAAADEERRQAALEATRRAAEEAAATKGPDDGSRAGQLTNVQAGVVAADEAAGANGQKEPSVIADAINSDDPDYRERTLKEYMAEFEASAPKYEGMDKWMTLAKIGFAIAAGQSPDAMANIANGLSEGVDMFMKDKMAKQEFDRQIKLSAMQYGLDMRKADRETTDYVASKDLTFMGREYKEGEVVQVPRGYMWDKGLPSGLTTPNLAVAMEQQRVALIKALQEAEEKDGPVRWSQEDRDKVAKRMQQYSDEFTNALVLRDKMQDAMIINSQGQVTGIKGGITRMLNNAANAMGIDLGEAAQNPAMYNSLLQNVAVNFTQELLGESGRTVSDADRALVTQLVGLLNDFQTGVFTDPDVLHSKLQNLINRADQTARSQLAAYMDERDAIFNGEKPVLMESGAVPRFTTADETFAPYVENEEYRQRALTIPRVSDAEWSEAEDENGPYFKLKV